MSVASPALVAEGERVAPEEETPPGAADPGYVDGLSLQHVSKRFESVKALADLSFSVERGRMLGFLGPNGAGKTTAMRAVFGLVQMDSGEVLWRGRPVRLEERLNRTLPTADQLHLRACANSPQPACRPLARPPWNNDGRT